jgi:hypothetical protein
MMKHRFLYLLLLPLLLAGCSKLEKDGLYYYYFSDKLYLSERRDLLYIEFTDGLSEAEKQAIVQSDPSLYPWTRPGRTSGPETYDGLGVARSAVLQSNGRISNAKFQRFRNKDGVKTLCYMYEMDGSSDPFAVSDHFSVQLSVGTTRAQLEALANRYGCTVRLWEGFSDRDDIYIVTVPKSVSMGVVRLSAVFQETHLFGWTSPDFVIFGAFDV